MSYVSFDISNTINISQDCSFAIKKIGQEFCSPHKCAENRTKNYGYYSLHFVMYGQGILRSGDKTYKLSPGFAFLLYKGEEYEYYPDSKNPWSYFWIDLVSEHPEEFFSCLGFSKENPVIKINQMKDLMPILKELYQSYSQRLNGDITYYGYLMLIIDRLLANNSNSYPIDTNVLSFKRIRDILIYMNNNYRTDLTPKDIGNKFNISYGTLMSTFRSEIDMAPMEYLGRFRISKACEMLREDNDLSIGEIAAIVGYMDQRYFSRLFKKIKGVTPTEYLNSSENDDPFDWLKEKNIDFR